MRRLPVAIFWLCAARSFVRGHVPGYLTSIVDLKTFFFVAKKIPLSSILTGLSASHLDIGYQPWSLDAFKSSLLSIYFKRVQSSKWLISEDDHCLLGCVRERGPPGHAGQVELKWTAQIPVQGTDMKSIFLSICLYISISLFFTDLPSLPLPPHFSFHSFIRESCVSSKFQFDRS